MPAMRQSDGAAAVKHLIELKALAAELGITPDEFKQIADERRLPFSFTTTWGHSSPRPAGLALSGVGFQGRAE
jgi:hypothetical protein